MKYPQKPGAPVIENIPGPFDKFIRNIVAAGIRGFDLERIRLELKLNDATSSQNPMEAAILQQGSRIVYETFKYTQK